MNDSNENKSIPPNVQVILCSSEEELRNHHIKGLPSIEPQYRCNICSKKYTSYSVLKNHLIRHKEKEDHPFHCMFCPYKAAAKRDLLRHHNQHVGHARQIFKCSECSKSFKNSSSLTEHTKSVHIKDTLYKCGLCAFMCWRRAGLRLHLKYHHSKIQIICPICDATFQNKANLKIHLLTHAGAKPFVCDKCPKRFTIKKHLTSHQQRVHSTRVFYCEFCQKRFPTIYCLKRHRLIHTGERPFKCCFCSFDSNTQGNLVTHVRRIHHLLNFTYKDILKKQGHAEDPRKALTSEDIKEMTDRGRETSESYLKALRDKGLTSASLEQLEWEMHMKKKSNAALTHSRFAKKPKLKKSKSTNSQKDREVKMGKSKEKNKRKESKTGFSFSHCNEFLLTRIEDADVIQTDNTRVEGLTTAPTIQVIWNANFILNAKRASLNKKPKSNRRQKSQTRKKSKKFVKQKVMLCNSVVEEQGDEQGEFCGPSSPSSATLTLETVPPGDSDQPPSNILNGNDNDLTFANDKPMLHHLQESSALQSCTGNALVTPLDNLHPDLGFDEIGAPNTVIVTSDGISYIDKVYKNLDLCNQFLRINDDDGHFISTLDSAHAHREFKVAKAEATKSSDASTAGKCSPRPSETSCKTESRRAGTFQTSVICSEINEQGCSTSENISILFASSKVNGIGVKGCYDVQRSNFALAKKEMNPSAFNSSLDEEDLVIDTEQERRTHLGKTGSEEVIMLDESVEAGSDVMVSSFLFIPEDTSSQPLKEITINGLNQNLSNEEMEVTTIAEIEENEGDLVLVIDAES